MRAVVLEGFGDVANLVLREVEPPVPGPGQVLVRVRAAGINFADVLWRRGLYPRCRFPHVLGFEIAGEVVAVGGGVTGFTPGQRVFGSSAGGGGYAELCLASSELLLPMPDGLSYQEAAAMPVIFGTVYYALVPMGRVSPGETVLIHAAGGGVGTVAVQWARSLGATVVATAGSNEKLERVKALGAEILINYRESEMAEAVRAAVVVSGKVRPIVGHTFPLSEVREAHGLLEGRSSFGKVIITP